MSDDGWRAWAALVATTGLGRAGLRAVAVKLDEQRRGAADLLGAPSESLIGLDLKPDVAAAASGSLAAPPEMATHLDGVAIITPDDEGYPHERLRSGAALPVILWVRGDPSLMSSPSLGISGSRASSAAAIELAAEIAMAAAREGVTVVTGGAAGVDSAAHRAAIDAGGTAVVVLAEGLGSSWFDPDDSVTVISEFPPGTPWMPRQAMQRNETIAALSDAVVVVACDVTGGSWAQGRLCLKKGVPLLVPGLPVDMAPGNLALLNERAGKAKDRIAVAFEPDDPEAPLRHLRAFRDAPESALGPTEQMTLLG